MHVNFHMLKLHAYNTYSLTFKVPYYKSNAQTVQPNNFIERDLRQEKKIITHHAPFIEAPSSLYGMNRPVMPILPKPCPHICRKLTQTQRKLNGRGLLVL